MDLTKILFANFESPELLVTNKSITRTGKTWEYTSQSIITKQKCFAPHNQNKRNFERIIQETKNKVLHVLQRYVSLFVFGDMQFYLW